MSNQEKSVSAQRQADSALEVKERRRTSRFEAAFDVSISKTDDLTRRAVTDAWVRDVSASGLGVSCASAFEIGDAVTVRAPGKSLLCEVRHCRAEGAMFSVGLEVLCSSDGTDIQLSLRELSRVLHFSNRTGGQASE